MNWIPLQDTEALNKLKEESTNQPVVLFKHSTRCSISSMVLNRLERSWKDEHGLKPYILDLIAYRAISDQIVDEFGVEHQSPQVIVIKDGKAVYDSSHMGINYNDLTSFSQN